MGPAAGEAATDAAGAREEGWQPPVGAPEFVLRASEPARQLRLGHVKARRELHVTVVMLDGLRLDVICDAKRASVAQVFQGAVRSERLEAWAGSLALAALVEGEFAFPPPATRLRKLCPGAAPAPAPPRPLPATPLRRHARPRRAPPPRPRWPPPRSTAVPAPAALGLTLFMRVWLLLPSQLSDAEGGRRLLYLELRRRLLEGALGAGREDALALAALALQAERGDPTSGEDEDGERKSKELDFRPEHYVSPVAAARWGLGPSSLAAEVSRRRRRLAGTAPSRARDAFVAAASRQPLAARHALAAAWVDASAATPVTLTVGVGGVAVLEAAADAPRRELLALPWARVRSLRPTARTLRLADAKGRKMKFHMQHKKSHYFFHVASLFREVYQKLHNQMVQMRFEACLERLKKEDKDEDENSGDNSVTSDSSSSLAEGFSAEADVFRQAVFCASTPGPKESGQLAENDTGGLKVPNVRSKLFKELDKDTLKEAYVLNSSVASVDEKFRVNLQETLSDTLMAKLDNISFDEERILHTVRLVKDCRGSLGMHLKSGEDRGVYVEGLAPGGPADLSRQILKGDRVVAVDGYSLLHKQFADALDLLNTTGQEVELVLSRLCSQH